jgi:CheY-like chemotaxis protein
MEAFERQAFDLVLMDMQMPHVDGLTATRGIRAREAASGQPRTPLAMLTANAMDDHRQMAAEAGADDLIAKPITPQSLVTGVLATLSVRQDAAPLRVAAAAR